MMPRGTSAHSLLRTGVLTAVLFFALIGIAPVLAAASPHVDSEVDTSRCAACHSSHSAGDVLLLRVPDGSVIPSSVCLNCHAGGERGASNVVTGPVNSFGLSSGHTLGIEGSGTAQITGCGTCHYAHGSSSSARRIPAWAINGVEVTAAGKDLCFACHDADDSWYGDGYPSTASPERDSAGFPVTGTWPGPGTYASSANAHRLIPESTRTVGASEPVLREQGDCLYCHGAHGGPNDYDGLVSTYTVPTELTLASDLANGSYAALCFSCHGGERPSGFLETPVNIKQFASGSGGHSVVTSGAALPVGSPLPCFECHNAHGSARGNLALISDERGGSLATTNPAGVRAFCFTCHTTSDTAAGWDSDAGAFEPVSSAQKVVGVPRDGGVLSLPDGEGHAEDDLESCYECHGQDYGNGGNNVHDPSDGTVSDPVLLGTAALHGLVTSETVLFTAAVPTSGTVESTGTILFAQPTSAADTTAPSTSSDATSAYVASATITLTAVDDTGGAGVADTYYRLDGGEVATGTVVDISIIGDHALTFWSVDRAGNVEEATTVEFVISSYQAFSIDNVQTTVFRPGRWIAVRGT